MERSPYRLFFRGSATLYTLPHCLPSTSGGWRGAGWPPQNEGVGERGTERSVENEEEVEEVVEAVKKGTRAKQLRKKEISRPHQSCRSHAT